MKGLGSGIIGALTAFAGFPVIKDGKLNPSGLIVCVLCCCLWLILCSIIEKKG